jgi:hypothetical protein
MPRLRAARTGEPLRVRLRLTSVRLTEARCWSGTSSVSWPVGRRKLADAKGIGLRYQATRADRLQVLGATHT